LKEGDNKLLCKYYNISSLLESLNQQEEISLIEAPEEEIGPCTILTTILELHEAISR
jgi:hypothetical protein